MPAGAGEITLAPPLSTPRHIRHAAASQRDAGQDILSPPEFHDKASERRTEHRVEAARDAGLKTIAADIRQGTRRDAILYSVGANAEHGHRRTNADKRRAVLRLLNDDKWQNWSDRKIARQAKVGHAMVSDLRANLSVHKEQIPTRTVTRGGTTYQQNTANIGRKPTAAPTIVTKAEYEADANGQPPPSRSAPLARKNFGIPVYRPRRRA